MNIIIKIIGDKYITLLDPFCGSGTTLVIAQELGIDSVGIDINPYAVLLSSVKTNMYDQNKILYAIEKIENNLNRGQSFTNYCFYNIEKWFREDIIRSLSKIRYCINLENNESVRKFFWIALSETIFKFSNDRTSTFKLHVLPREKINLIQDECIVFFVNTIKENAKHLNYEKKNKSDIVYGDCCEVMKHKLNKKFKIICTSPPYGDNSTTVTYGQSSILSLKWMDIKDLSCELETLDKYSTIDRMGIGGEKRVICNTQNIESLNNYLSKISATKRAKVINFFEDYYVVLKSMESCLAKDGYLIMTVGNRSIDAIKQPLDEVTIEIAEKLGLKVISKFNRNILNKKTPLTLSSAKDEKVVKSISEETILIFTK